MITNICEFWAYFAPLISETGFAGILATVNGLILISIFPCAKVGSGMVLQAKKQPAHHLMQRKLLSFVCFFILLHSENQVA